MKLLGALTCAIAAVMSLASMSRADDAVLPDQELIRLETAKWDSAGPLTPESFDKLFAEDFISVQYGSWRGAGRQRGLLVGSSRQGLDLH